MVNTRNLTLMALLVAIGTLSAHLVWFPAGVAKAFPIQHAINVLAAATLGPANAGIVALLIGIMRNILGVGTPLAFPGGIVGAVLAGLFYRAGRRPIYAAMGEVIGTGLFGALLSYPIAKYVLGKETITMFFFIIPFSISSISGAILGYLALAAIRAGTPARAAEPAGAVAADINTKGRKHE